MSIAKSVEGYDESLTPYKTIELSKEEYGIFIFFLNKIKAKFNDFSLVDGAFRSFSNDKNIMIETGFPFFREVSFDLTEIKKKTKTLSTFRKKDTVNFSFNDSGYSIYDGVSSLDFVKPHPDHLDNKYIPDEDMKKSILEKVDPNKALYIDSINKKMVSRTKQISQKLASKNILLKNSSNSVSLTVYGKKDESAEASTELKRPLIVPLDENAFLKLPVLPFTFDKDHLNIKCYFNYDQTVTVMYSTKIKNILINIYSQSKIFCEDKEKEK